ncbi:MAG TPA: exodeoxyribonuclease V subunit alpha [Zeimonas sp.]
MTRETRIEAKAGERVARAFGDAVARLHARTGGSADVAALVGRWAQHAWMHADAGHVCITVSDRAQRERLVSSPAVDAAGNVREAPLVLDGDALYLQRLWRAEQRLAERIAELDVPAPLGEASAVAGVVDSLFAPAEADDAQRRALLRGLGHRLTLLSGGPGTGKTTTLARLLVAFARLAPDARVAFAAPTGKAAARLGQSLSNQLARLDPAGELRARLPEAGMTVHRLLGLRAGSVVAAPAWDQPPSLDYDLVLVDEASMLDIEIAAALVSAAGPNVRLVLAGDRDQLASVEAGAVFADLCASAGDAMVELLRNHRQKDAAHIVELAVQVRDASRRESVRCGPGASRWPAAIALRRPDPAAIVDDALAAWAEVREAIDARSTPAQVLAACERHRVLTALRQGPLGSVALNRRIAAAVRHHAARSSGAGGPAFAPWYAGRLVLVTANRPALGLFNGDVGVCVPRPDADDAAGGDLVVAFAGAEAPRLFPVAQMPACEDAWAMTVHKSQGSEFESVALVLAPQGHALNTRELVYTGITRARNRLAIWAESDAVAAAALTRTERHGRLAQRLAACIGDRNAE